MILICISPKINNAFIVLFHWKYFQVIFGHLYIFFEEMSIQVFCLYWKLGCLSFAVEFQEFFIFFWILKIYFTELWKSWFWQFFPALSLSFMEEEVFFDGPYFTINITLHLLL